ATTTIEPAFHNSGVVEVSVGTFWLRGYGLSAGSFTVSAGANLRYSGLLRGRISGGGNLDLAGEVAGSLAVTGQIRIVDGSVAFTTNTVLPNLFLGQGILTGDAEVVVTGLFSWAGGGSTGRGRFVALGDMNITSGYFYGRTIENHGRATWTGPGMLTSGFGGTFHNLPGAVFEAQSDWTMDRQEVVTSAAFLNAGTFRKTGGTGTTNVEYGFHNAGTVEVQSRTLNLRYGGTHSGTFAVAEGRTLIFGGGTQTLTASSRVIGTGTVEFRWAFINGEIIGNTRVGGVYAITGPTLINGGNADFVLDVTLPSLT